MDISVEFVLGQLLAYMVSLSATLQGDAIIKKQTAELEQSLRKNIEKYRNISSTKPIQTDLEAIATQVSRVRVDAGLTQSEQPLFRIFCEAHFQQRLARWIVANGVAERESLRLQIFESLKLELKLRDVSENDAERAIEEYFIILERKIFQDPMLSRWLQHQKISLIEDKIENIFQSTCNIPSEADRHRALERFRAIALESCDIVDLAGLPEYDVNIAMQRFLLRQLYVPLRLQIEKLGGDGQDLAALEDLERRREIQRLKSAGRTDQHPLEPQERLPIGTRMEARKHFIVLGDPGAGKTTLLRWIATSYLLRTTGDPEISSLPDVSTLPDASYLPVLIRCRDLTSESLLGSLSEIISLTLRKSELTHRETNAVQVILEEKLAAGEVILLIDGLDEILEPKVRVQFCRQIEKVAIAYPRAVIIATSRIVGYKEMNFKLGRGFEHLTVADLVKDEKDEFARRWCALTEPLDRRERRTRELIQAIHSSDRIERLTGNPMLLTTLALVKRKVGKLPNRRSDLYKEAVEVLLNWRAEVNEPLDRREAIPQLEYIAYEMCKRGVQRLTEDQILELLDQIRKEYPSIRSIRNRNSEDFLRALERQTSILVESGFEWVDGQQCPVYEFRHLTFQEYLAGLAIITGRYSGHSREIAMRDRIAPLAGLTKEVKLRYQADAIDHQVADNWKEALRLAVGSCVGDQVEDALLGILEPCEGEDVSVTTRPRAILSALCLADEPDISEETGEKIIERLLSVVKAKDGQEYSPTGLTSAVLELRSSEWTAPFLTALVTKYKGTTTHRRPLARIIALLCENADEPEKIAALNEEIEKGLSSISDFEVAISIFRALHLAEAQQLLLSESLLTRLKQLVQIASFQSYGAAKVLSTIAGLHQQDGDVWDKCPEDIDMLKAILESNTHDPETVQEVMDILDEWKIPLEPSILTFLIQQDDPRLGHCAVAAIEHIEPELGESFLIDFLQDGPTYLRRHAASILGRIGTERCVEMLVALLDDQDPEVVELARTHLCRIGEPRVLPHIQAKLKCCDRDELARVLWSVDLLGDPTFTSVLKQFEADENPEIALRARCALLGLNDQETISKALLGLQQLDLDHAFETLWKLKDISSQPVIDAIVELARSGIEALDEFSIEALAANGSPEAIDGLRELFLTCNEALKSQIVWSAGSARLKELGVYIRPLVASENKKLQKAAVYYVCKVDLNETERHAVSLDLSDEGQIHDPRKGLSENRKRVVARRLNLTPDQVEEIYERVALKLSEQCIR